MLKSVSYRILDRIETRLHYLYGEPAHSLANRLFMMIGRYGIGLDGYRVPSPTTWDERDITLITYGDMVHTTDEAPLKTLHHFLKKRLYDAIQTVHILPFFPYSSDDGFSVIDYRRVDPKLGTWKDVADLRTSFNLMFDLVINHVSRQSSWFKDYVNDIDPYRHFFIEVDSQTDVSCVVRPRNLPLLTEAHTRHGPTHVWTTFSSDQIDVNFGNPEVLFEYLDILMSYIAHGARVIRLDAIAYLWKAIGTPCIHLTQTHEVVKLIRDFLSMIAPDVWLITETNVPHDENISYFSNGDEAHMVYQFSLPPLIAHGLLNQNASHLTQWAAALPTLDDKQAFFNFTASHDGVGVRPLQGLVPDAEVKRLVEHVERLGGRVSWKRDSDGSQSPYELNITYFDLLGDDPTIVTEAHIQRFLSSQAIMLAMRGMPAVYFNSLFGARNHQTGLAETGHNRTLNRQKWDQAELIQLLDTPDSHTHRVFTAYLHLLQTRRSHAAFHPSGDQRVILLGDALFALLRVSPSSDETILCVTNFSHEHISICPADCEIGWTQSTRLRDLLQPDAPSGQGAAWQLLPFQTVWLTLAL